MIAIEEPFRTGLLERQNELLHELNEMQKYLKFKMSTKLENERRTVTFVFDDNQQNGSVDEPYISIEFDEMHRHYERQYICICETNRNKATIIVE